MKQYPEPIAGLFIFNPLGEVLLIKTHKWNGSYCCPGGHIELGETIDAALKREAKEETGLDIYDPQLFCVWEYVNDGKFHKEGYFIFLNHICKTKSSHVILNDEAQEFIWVKPEKLLDLALEAYTKKTLEKFIAEKPQW